MAAGKDFMLISYSFILFFGNAISLPIGDLETLRLLLLLVLLQQQQLLTAFLRVMIQLQESWARIRLQRLRCSVGVT
jgi:hypothetical protein